MFNSKLKKIYFYSFPRSYGYGSDLQYYSYKKVPKNIFDLYYKKYNNERIEKINILKSQLEKKKDSYKNIVTNAKIEDIKSESIRDIVIEKIKSDYSLKSIEYFFDNEEVLFEKIVNEEK